MFHAQADRRHLAVWTEAAPPDAGRAAKALVDRVSSALAPPLERTMTDESSFLEMERALHGLARAGSASRAQRRTWSDAHVAKAPLTLVVVGREAESTASVLAAMLRGASRSSVAAATRPVEAPTNRSSNNDQFVSLSGSRVQAEDLRSRALCEVAAVALAIRSRGTARVALDRGEGHVLLAIEDATEQ